MSLCITLLFSSFTSLVKNCGNEMKIELVRSLMEADVYEIEELARTITNCKKAIPVVKNTRQSLVCKINVYRQGYTFKKFKESNKFVEMVN